MAAMHYAALPLRTSQGMMSNVFGNGIAIITMQVPTIKSQLCSPVWMIQLLLLF